MSRPSKRFVLPYEPEYTAHRTERRARRAVQLHRLVRRHVLSPGLIPDACAVESAQPSDARASDRRRKTKASRLKFANF